MMKWTKNGVSVLAVLDTRHIRKDNTYTAKIQVCYRSRQVYYSTGKCLSAEDWAVIDKTKKRELLAVRDDIESTFELVRRAVDDIATEAYSFSFEVLNARLRGATTNTLNDAFDTCIERLRSNGQIGTGGVYSNTRNCIARFAGDRVVFADITVDWLQRFERFMREEGCKQTYIAILMRTLRAVMNRARRVGIVSEAQYPFGSGRYEIQEGEGRKLVLTLPQIEQLAHYTCDDAQRLRARDFFLFLFYCNGINVADMANLRYRDIQDGEILFERAKTRNTLRCKKSISVCITPPLQDIINRHGVQPRLPNRYIFGVLRDDTPQQDRRRIIQNFTRHINHYMGVIARELNLPHISTYTARHSFATALSAANINIKHISESLGHTSVTTTERYIHSLDRQARRDIAEVLLRGSGEHKQ